MQHAAALEHGFENEHATIALMDVLQTNGVAPETAANVAASLARNKHRFRDLQHRLFRALRFVNSLTDRCPSFIELYGRGSIMEAAHGCRRNLNLQGLDALDLRTCKKRMGHPGTSLAQKTANWHATSLRHRNRIGPLDPRRALPFRNLTSTGIIRK